MKKRLIALMLASTITATALTGCNSEFDNENEIREMLEYDANTNLSEKHVKSYGIGVDYDIVDEKFYITFKSYISKAKKTVGIGTSYELEDDVKIKYEVDKDTYYNFRHNYSTREEKEHVDMVKLLVEKYDPIEVINPSMDNIEK